VGAEPLARAPGDETGTEDRLPAHDRYASLTALSSRSWVLCALALLGVLLAADLATGDATVLVALYAAAPAVATLGATAAATAGVGAAAVVAGVVAELVLRGTALTGQDVVRPLSVLVVAVIAAWAALLRDGVERGARRERLVAAAGEALAGTGELRAALQRVADLATEGLARGCAIELLDGQGASERVAAAGAAQERAVEIPLEAGAGRLGTLRLAPRGGAALTEEDAEVARELARRCAAAIEAERLRGERAAAEGELLEAFGLLDVIFDRAPVGLAFFDRDLRYARVNERLAEINGIPAREHLGRTVSELLPEMSPEVPASLRHVLATGEPLVEVEVAGKTPARPGVRREWLVSYWPVRRGPAEIIGLGAVVYETTERRAAERALRAQTDRYETLLLAVSEAGEGMLVLEQGRCVYANPAFEALSGYVAPELRAMESVLALFPDDAQREARRLEAGGVQSRVALALRRRDGRRVELEAAAVPLAVGEHRQVVVLVRDVTAARRAERERDAALRTAQFLAEASEVFDRSLDEERTLHGAARLCVRDLALTCVIALGPSPAAPDRVVAVAREPERERILAELQEDFPLPADARHPAVSAHRSGRGVVARLSDELLRELAASPRHLELMRALGTPVAAVVPLRARGGTLGIMSLGLAELPPEEEPRRLALFEDVARRLALALDTARLYAERSHVARTLQRSLLPGALPEVPGLELAARYVAAGEGNEVGGDFYDGFATTGDEWALVIGDVCGKGPEAAAITALVRYTTRAAVLHSREPLDVLSQLNEAILRQGLDYRFCTVLYAALRHCGTGLEARLATGGHPLPLVVRAAGGVQSAGRPGTLLGVVESPRLSEATVRLEPGDALLLYTDGVIEASPADAAFGPERLAALLGELAGQDADRIAAGVERAVLEVQGGRPRDDVAIVVARVAPGAAALPGARAGEAVASAA
jgi:PAS domain S-box-containing protein